MQYQQVAIAHYAVTKHGRVPNATTATANRQPVNGRMYERVTRYERHQ
jgi:hypothetical protein